MFEQVEEVIGQGKELLKKKQPIKKPICPLCKKELDYHAGGIGGKDFYRCINLNCNMVGIARYMQGIKPNE